MIPASFNTGEYDVIYKLAHLFATAYFSINSASIDALYLSLIALCTAQLQILERKLINVLEDAEAISENFHGKNLNTAAEDILKECIVLHDTINSILPFFTNMPVMIPASFNTGEYDVIYKLAHLFATAYFSINSASIDALYLSLIALCTAQLQILERKLINVLEDAEAISENFHGKNLNTAAEDILKECIVLHDTINRYKKDHCPTPRSNKTVGQKNHKYIAPRLYNSLPSDIKSITSFASFKTRCSRWLLMHDRKYTYKFF
ncbi:hypothetical protein QE152_g27316 [Popillia japonica]|uniref:Uncharacterized protein n=1 Tax=Popillia japonica TaxID=7064 RepID=A0AAW1JV35_POPJA